MKVLVAVDESDLAAEAFDWYFSNVHRENTQVIVFSHVATPCIPLSAKIGPSGEEISLLINEHGEMVKKLKDKYEDKAKTREVSVHIIITSAKEKAGEAIIETAQSFGVNLVVIGSRGMGTARRTIFGSVSDYVVHHLNVPVLIFHK